jgi:hypothetical protein
LHFNARLTIDVRFLIKFRLNVHLNEANGFLLTFFSSSIPPSLFPPVSQMPEYRIYLLGKGDRILEVEAISCATDRDAVARAIEITQQEGVGAEVWQGARLIVKLPRPPG